MNEKVLINFCPTGMVPTKDLTPFVPITPSEIVEQTIYELTIPLHATNLSRSLRKNCVRRPQALPRTYHA